MPLPVVSAQLSRASPRVTSQVYAHLVGDDLDRAAAVFDRLAAPESAPDGAGGGAGNKTDDEIPIPEGEFAT